MTSHTLQQGELSSRLEQIPGAALPQALCSSCSLGKLCKATHTSQLMERKVSAQHRVSESSKRLFLSRSSRSFPCRTPPLIQAHKQPVFKEEVQLYSAEGTWGRNPTYFPKRRWYTGEETQQMGVWRHTPDIYLEYINYIFNSHSLMAYSQLLKYSSGVD